MSALAYYEERKATEIQVAEEDSMTFPPHLHADLELFLVQSGCFEVAVGESVRTMPSDTLAVIFPNTIHSYKCVIPGSRFIMAICGTQLLGDSLTRLTRFRPVCPFLQGTDLHRDIPYAMHALVTEFREGQNRDVYRALIRLILARCFSKMELQPIKEPKAIDLTAGLVRYLLENFQKPLSLEQTARELGVSQYHLSHVLSSRLHTSFPEYVNFLRLESAREQLCTTEQSVMEIGMNCGFSSQRTFNRVFRKRFGCSPREMRREQSGK